MYQTIYIIGAGAIGKALAVFLKLEGRKVILVRGSVDKLGSIIKTISMTYANNSSLTAEVEITTFSQLSNLNGLIVLTNKSYGNKNLAEKLKAKIGNNPLVLLQNGLGIEQVFVDNKFTKIYRCVLFATCQIGADNKLNFKPVAICPIGIINGDESELDNLISALNTPYFQFKSECNIQSIIWKKAVVNIIFNSICPLLEIDNGIFFRNEAAIKMAKSIIDECLLVSGKLGIRLLKEEVLESVLLISKMSDGQLISTLQDINNGRKTEIETLNHVVVAIAKSQNLGHKILKTKLLGDLTLLKSEINI